MRRRILVPFFIIATFFFGLVAVPAHAASPADSQQANATAIADLVDRHNAIRSSRGLSPLKFAPKISQQVSQPWSMRMGETNNLSHNSDFGWSGAAQWAENVANSSASDATTHLMKMWMDSSGHRTNMLNGNYTTIAIGLVKKNGVTWATANFYAGSLRNPGTLYSSGASWLAGADSNPSSVDVYTTPGTHHVNGRDWRTSCVPYSKTKRCRTEIWATALTNESGRFHSRNGWVFNNMTYLPSPRSLWKNNNLGKNANWTADGRRWRTECDTAVTGRNGCRSYISASVVVATKTASGYRYSMDTQWVFNNMVQFS